MMETRSVLIRPQHWVEALRLFRIFTRENGYRFGMQIMEQVLDLPDGRYREMVDGLSCGACGAQANHPCLTASGRRASSPHKERWVTPLAVVLAMQEETVISEEQHIEDVLTDA